MRRGLFGVRKKMFSTSQACPSDAQLQRQFCDFLAKYGLGSARIKLSMALNSASHASLRALSHLLPVDRAKHWRSRIHARIGRTRTQPIVGKDLDLKNQLFLWSIDRRAAQHARHFASANDPAPTRSLQY